MGDASEEIVEANFSSIVKVFLGVLLFFAALTQLWLGMRVLMSIGGFCAEGGPYLVTTPCPKSLTTFTPLSIIVMIAGRGLYLSSQFSKGPKWDFLFWTILFISLGWNFGSHVRLSPPPDEKTGVRRRSRIDQMKSVSPSAIAGVWG